MANDVKKPEADRKKEVAQQRVFFEHVFFAVLERRAGIGSRPKLQEELEKKGYPSNSEWTRRHLRANEGLSDKFIAAVKAVAPNLTDQDWIDILWARIHGATEEPPKVSR